MFNKIKAFGEINEVRDVKSTQRLFVFMKSVRFSYRRNWLKFFNDVSGDNFTLKQPHSSLYQQVLKMLKKDFDISPNQSYVEHYKCLAKYHKKAVHKRKKDFWIGLEIDARGFEMEFGYERNCYHNESKFWDKSDSRYKHTTYLEDKLVLLNINKVLDFLVNKGISLDPVDTDKLTPTQKIINNDLSNPHIHGGAKSLYELHDYIENAKINGNGYSCRYHYRDKNNNTLSCGEEKYFYDYDKRLKKGIVHHHINNMWWVVCNNVLHNKACFDLFDFDSSLTRRVKLDNESLKRKLESKIQYFVNKKDFKRCQQIQNYLDKIAIKGTTIK